MTLQETKKVLDGFGKNVITKSRSNLTRKNKNYKRSLYDSLDFDLKVSKNSFSLSFIMEEYGMYQDKGVSGKEVKHKTPYAFKNKMPPIKPIADWAKFRNIRLRDSKGRFAKGSYKTIGFLIARSIYKKGIKPSLFFTKPFTKAYGRLPDELIEAYGLDLDNFLDFTTDGKS